MVMRNKLRDEVIKEILRTVEKDGLSSGDFLPPERELSESLQVSRTVVREALSGLEMQGMLELKPGKRPILRERYDKAIRETLRLAVGAGESAVVELTEVRRIFEPEIAALAARRHSPEELARLVEVHEEMRRLIDTPQGYVGADFAFHDQLLVMSANRVMLSAIRPVGELLLESRSVTAWRRRPTSDALAEHQEILDRVVERDADGARDAMTRHIHSTIEDVRAALDDPSAFTR